MPERPHWGRAWYSPRRDSWRGSPATQVYGHLLMNVPCRNYHSRVPARAAPRVLIAPQSFKGSADAVAVAAAIARGVRRAWPDAQVEEMPLADGGEGTVRALVRATRGTLRTARVHDPLGREITAEWGVLGDGVTAVVEMAAASGPP